jgi:hypothetical protein
MILEVIALTGSEIPCNGVALRTQLAPDLPPFKEIESSCNK